LNDTYEWQKVNKKAINSQIRPVGTGFWKLAEKPKIIYTGGMKTLF
jgi:hypothetical protein